MIKIVSISLVSGAVQSDYAVRYMALLALINIVPDAPIPCFPELR